MTIAVIGGGLSGLVAAYKLSPKKENKVALFEKNSELGGMLASYITPNYAIEEYYHHIFPDNFQTIKIISELGLEKNLKWFKAKNGYYINKTIYPLNTPFDFTKLPHLNFYDLIKLAFLIREVKKNRDYKKLDGVSAKKWVINNSSEKIWRNFIYPLVSSKFGNYIENISAAWLVKRIQIRSNNTEGSELLGYLGGGFKKLTDKLKEEIEKNGGKIYRGNAVREIIIRNNAAEELTLEQGQKIKADKIIFTASENLLQKIIHQNLKFPRINYQGSVCVLLSLKEKLTDNIYWLNIKDEDIPFRVLIEHTNLIYPANYGREHLVYLSYYFQNTEDAILKMADSEIIDLYCDKLKMMFPRFERKKVNWWKVKKEFLTAPIYETGYLEKIIPCRTGIKNLYVAGINSQNHWPDRSIEGSIACGLEAANLVAENS